jgi:dihydroflavonol-4-reductase
MRALVTGATGIVGNNLVRELLDNDYEVRVLVRPASDTTSLRRLPVECWRGDILDIQSLVGVADKCSFVFHAAALFAYSGFTQEELDEIAVDGTRNIITATAHSDAERVVVTSSTVTLGSATRPVVHDERNSFEDRYPPSYTLSKVLQEKAAFEIARELGLDLVVVCPGLTVGPFDYRLSPSNATIVNYLNDPMRFTFPGGCNIVSARDVAAGHVIAALHGVAGSRYVVGGENLHWRDVHRMISALAGTFGPTYTLNNTSTYLAGAAAEMSARIMGKRPSVTRDEATMACRYYWYSSDALTRLGYSATPCEGALAEALAWLIHRSYLSESVVDRLEPDDRVRKHLQGLRGVAA